MASLIANFVEAYHASLVALPRELPKSDDDKALVQALLEVLKAHVLAGEIVCVEAASKAIVENVVALAKDLGIIAEKRIVEEKRPVLDEMISLLARARPRR